MDGQTRLERVSKTPRPLDHVMHASACITIARATATDCATILEGLKGMPRGRIKFNKRTRSRLNAAAMKFQRLILGKAAGTGSGCL